MSSEQTVSASVSSMRRTDEPCTFEALKKALKRSIALHMKLGSLLRDDNRMMRQATPESLRKANALKTVINREIERTNGDIAAYYSQCFAEADRLDYQKRREIDMLVEMLRRKMHEALRAIGDSIQSVKDEKRRVVGAIREINSRQSAVNSYMRAQSPQSVGRAQGRVR